MKTALKHNLLVGEGRVSDPPQHPVHCAIPGFRHRQCGPGDIGQDARQYCFRLQSNQGEVAWNGMACDLTGQIGTGQSVL